MLLLSSQTIRSRWKGGSPTLMYPTFSSLPGAWVNRPRVLPSSSAGNFSSSPTGKTEGGGKDHGRRDCEVFHMPSGGFRHGSRGDAERLCGGDWGLYWECTGEPISPLPPRARETHQTLWYSRNRSHLTRSVTLAPLRLGSCCRLHLCFVSYSFEGPLRQPYRYKTMSRRGIRQTPPPIHSPI